MWAGSAEHCATYDKRKGLWSDRDTESCALVLRKAAFSGAEDVGWKLDNKGALRMIYDVDDTDKLADAFGVGNFSSALSQYYTAAVAKTNLELSGYGCEVSKTAAGEVQVVGTDWSC